MITQIRLINCQAFVDSTFNLATDKLNVIIARNGTGKSILLKMLKITASPSFYSAKKRKKLIRLGADSAMIMFAFSDGAIGYTRVFPTRVLYGFKAPGEQGVRLSVEPPEELVKEVDLLVNQAGKFVANIIDTDQNLLLVDSDSKSNSELLRLLVTNEDLSNLRERTEEAIAECKNALQQQEVKLDRVTAQLNTVQYVDVEAKEKRLKTLRVVRDVMYTLIGVHRSCQKLAGCMCPGKDFRFLISMCELTSVVEGLPFRACEVEQFDERLLQICRVLEEVEARGLRECNKPKEPVDVRYADVLGGVESLPLASVPVRAVCDVDEELRRASALGKLEEMVDASRRFRDARSGAEQCATRVEELEHQFRSSGAVHKCEIYGEVVWDGENCVPSSF